MSRTERAIAKIAPRYAARRLRDRSAFESLDRFFGRGSYRGASRTARELREWNAPSQSADADTIPDLNVLRGRSRDLVRNAPIAAGAVNTVATSVVGTGLKVQSNIDASVLGVSEDAAREWERKAERVFRLWTTQCDVTRIQTFHELQDLVLRSQLESGDVLVVRRFSKRAGDLLGTKVQIVEADRLSSPYGREHEERMYDGVEVDAQGAPVRYHVANRNPADLGFFRRRDPLDWVSIRAFTERGERNALHVYERKRPGLHRGVPYLAPVIEPLKQISRYTEAEIAAAVIASFFTVFVKSEGSSPGFANEQTAGTKEGELSETHEMSSPSRDLRMGPAAVIDDLDPGESIEQANPMRPNTSFDPFVVAVLRQVGVALEIPYEILVKHFQSSYSAARGAILEAWRFFKRRRNFLVTSFCQPVYRWVIAEAVAQELLEAPGFFEDPMIREAWLGTTWTGDPQGHVQPVQEVEALLLRRDGGLISETQAVQEDSGGDFERVQRQRARDRELREELGIENAAARGGAKPPPAGTDRED